MKHFKTKDCLWALYFFVMQAWCFCGIGMHFGEWMVCAAFGFVALSLGFHLGLHLVMMGERRQLDRHWMELLRWHNRIVWRQGLYNLVFTNVHDYRDYLKKQLGSQ